MQNCQPHMKLSNATEVIVSALHLNQRTYASHQDTSTGMRCYDVPSALIGALLKMNDQSLSEAPIFVGKSKANARAAKILSFSRIKLNLRKLSRNSIDNVKLAQKKQGSGK